jgi:signal transduction histidine kinase
MSSQKGEVEERTQTPRGRLLRKYIVVILLLVGGVLVLSSTVDLYFSYQETKTALIRLEREQAVAAAARIERFVQDIERQVRWTTQTAFDEPAAASEQREIDYLRLLRNVPAIAEIRHLDASGKEQLRVSRLALDAIGSQEDYSQSPKFVLARTGATYFGPVYFRNESEPYMTIAVPTGEYGVEVTVAEVNLRAIWDVVSRIRIGKAGYAYVVDSVGHLVAHPDISLVLQKRDLSALPQVRAARLTPGASDETTGMIAPGLQGGQFLASYAPIALLGWLVFVEQPLSEAFAPLQASVARSALLVALGLVLSVLASVLLARRMVAPIRALQTGAARIGAGNLAHRIDVRTGDELEALGEEFNRTAAQLQESYATLEEKVEARTRELAGLVERLRALAETSQTVSSTLDLQTVLSSIVAHAVKLVACDAGAIYEYDDATQQVDLRVTYRTSEDLVAALRTRPLGGEGALGRAIATREPVQVPDLAAAGVSEGGLAALLVRAGYRALLAVPLIREDQIVGGLVVRRRAPGEFPPELVDLLRTFASQSTLAIQNARLFREIEDKSRQLEIASRHKSQFLANMSHELRTPLNAILGYTELILDGIYGEVPGKVREVLQRLETSGKHLLGLINDVLDLSKIEAGQLTLSLTEYSMKEVVNTVVTTVESLAAEKRLALKVAMAPTLPRGRGDERRLTQVLLNLVGNALKFTEEGEVRIDAEATDGTFVVAVCDTGPGISEADQAKIFEEFQQVDSSSTRKKGGTGLGLSIARRIVELHGGRLSVASSPGQGSIFTFRLPVRVERQAALS